VCDEDEMETVEDPEFAVNCPEVADVGELCDEETVEPTFAVEIEPPITDVACDVGWNMVVVVAQLDNKFKAVEFRYTAAWLPAVTLIWLRVQLAALDQYMTISPVVTLRIKVTPIVWLTVTVKLFRLFPISCILWEVILFVASIDPEGDEVGACDGDDVTDDELIDDAEDEPELGVEPVCEIELGDGTDDVIVDPTDTEDELEGELDVIAELGDGTRDVDPVDPVQPEDELDGELEAMLEEEVSNEPVVLGDELDSEAELIDELAAVDNEGWVIVADEEGTGEVDANDEDEEAALDDELPGDKELDPALDQLILEDTVLGIEVVSALLLPLLLLLEVCDVVVENIADNSNIFTTRENIFANCMATTPQKKKNNVWWKGTNCSKGVTLSAPPLNRCNNFDTSSVLIWGSERPTLHI
jgi:hypothetical protein